MDRPSTERLAAGYFRFFPVMLNVQLRCFRGVMRGVVQVPLGGMRMVGPQFMVTSFVMRRRFAMMPSRVIVMFCRLMMMFCRLLGHESSSSTLVPAQLHGSD